MVTLEVDLELDLKTPSESVGWISTWSVIATTVKATPTTRCLRGASARKQ